MGRRVGRFFTVEPRILSAARRRELMEAAAARSRRSTRGAFGRLRVSAGPLAQTVAAAVAAWLVATQALGHPRPVFAPVAAIIALGATRAQRGRHAIELMIGVALGVGLADLLLATIGTGIAQLALVISAAMVAAVLLNAGPVLLTEAAVSATLVVTVTPAAQGFPPPRLLDALAGGAAALLFSQILFPVHPLRIVGEAAESVLAELGDTLDEVAGALERRDQDAAERALLRSRRISEDWSRFEQALDLGAEAARFAPRRRRLRSRFATYRDVGTPLDLMVSDVRVLARGAVRALVIGDDVPSPVIEALRCLADAVRAIAGRIGVDDPDSEVCERALDAARLATTAAPRDDNLSLSILVGYAQATAADVLRALGLEREPAHEMVGQAAIAAGDAAARSGVRG